MSKRIHEFFKKNNLQDLVFDHKTTANTVENAAKLLNVLPDQIGKTMSFLINDEPILIVSSGLSKIDNKKYKDFFKVKAKMIPYDLVEHYIGHKPGGICPFDVNVKVYLDESVKKYDVLYMGGGDEFTTVKVTIEQLKYLSNYTDFVDICKNN